MACFHGRSACGFCGVEPPCPECDDMGLVSGDDYGLPGSEVQCPRCFSEATKAVYAEADL